MIDSWLTCLHSAAIGRNADGNEVGFGFGGTPG